MLKTIATVVSCTYFIINTYNELKVDAKPPDYPVGVNIQNKSKNNNIGINNTGEMSILVASRVKKSKKGRERPNRFGYNGGRHQRWPKRRPGRPQRHMRDYDDDDDYGNDDDYGKNRSKFGRFRQSKKSNDYYDGGYDDSDEEYDKPGKRHHSKNRGPNRGQDFV